ncbi:DUF5666 domain-containing protein [Chloroflexota bacterium]
MMRKIVLSTLLVGLIGVLVAGAIIRTVDKTENVAEAQGLGGGRHGNAAGAVADGLQGEARVGYGQARLQSGNVAERQYPNYDGAPEDWMEYEGTVLQAPVDGADLVIQTADGEELTVGTGPGYLAAQGFILEAGDQVQVRGYWEDGELKASQLTRARDQKTIVLRDELGRPAWAGNGRRALERSAQTSSDNGSGGQGKGYGRQSSEDSQPSGAAGPTAPISGQTGQGQASVDEWLTVDGAVQSVDTSTLIVRSLGGEVTVQNRAWWFAQDQGFTAQVGDQVTLRGFYEGDDFEVGSIVNHTSGETALIREENGRPLWAGGGRRGG